MAFEENIHAEVRGAIKEPAQLLSSQNARHEQNGIGSEGASFKDLVFINDKILSQGRLPNLALQPLKIFYAHPEVFPIREDGNGFDNIALPVRPCCFLDVGREHCPHAGGFLFYFSDDPKVARFQCLSEADWLWNVSYLLLPLSLRASAFGAFNLAFLFPEDLFQQVQY